MLIKGNLVIRSKGQKGTIKAQKSSLYYSEDYIPNLLCEEENLNSYQNSLLYMKLLTPDAMSSCVSCNLSKLAKFN